MNDLAAAPPTFSLVQLGRSTAVLAAATTVGQVVVVGRELFVAANVGTSYQLDALLVAVVLPLVLSGVALSGLQAALVPVYVETLQLEGRAQASGFVGGVLGWALVLASLGLVAALVLAEPAVAIAGPGLGPEGRAAALGFVPLVALLIVVVPVGTVLSAVCQAHQRFSMIAASLVAGSIASAVATVGLWSALGLWALAIAFVVNATTALLVLAVGLGRAGDLPRPTLRLDRSRTRGFLRHLLPLTAGSAVLQLNLFADRAVASLLRAGSVSALRYGEQLINAPLNVVSSAWSTVIYPALVATTGANSRHATGAAASAALRHVAAVFIPVGAAIAALAPLVVDVLYRRGAFDVEASVRTAGVVASLAPLLPLLMATSVLVAAHNARRRGALVGTAAILNAALNLALNLALAPILGVAGVALSTSLTLTIVVLFFGWRLAVNEPGFDARGLTIVVVKSALATAAAAIPVAYLAWGGPASGATLPLSVAWIAGLALAGSAIYLAAAAAIGLREPGTVIAVVGGALRRRRIDGR